MAGSSFVETHPILNCGDSQPESIQIGKALFDKSISREISVQPSVEAKVKRATEFGTLCLDLEETQARLLQSRDRM